MENKEINKGIEKMNEVIEEYKETLKNLLFSISEDEEDNALANIYKALVDIRVNSNILKNKIDDYLMFKKFYEEDVQE